MGYKPRVLLALVAVFGSVLVKLLELFDVHKQGFQAIFRKQ
jgi:hypothetical protein